MDISEPEQQQILDIAEAINQLLDTQEMYYPLKMKKQIRGEQ
tara:strand:- start:115 stop:240 length:126 start_codon:yes stop_codon:yes gene_type:complete